MDSWGNNELWFVGQDELSSLTNQESPFTQWKHCIQGWQAATKRPPPPKKKQRHIFHLNAFFYYCPLCVCISYSLRFLLVHKPQLTPSVDTILNLLNPNLKNSAITFQVATKTLHIHISWHCPFKGKALIDPMRLAVTDWMYFVYSTTINLIIDCYPQNFTHTSLCSALSHLFPAIAIRMSGGPYLVNSLIQFFKAWNELWNSEMECTFHFFVQQLKFCFTTIEED